MPNMDSLIGKIIAGPEADTGEMVAYIVDDNRAPALQNVAKLLSRYNGKHVRLTVEEQHA